MTHALAYLLDNTFVTGQVLFVDGGESIAQAGRHAVNAPATRSAGRPGRKRRSPKP